MSVPFRLVLLIILSLLTVRSAEILNDNQSLCGGPLGRHGRTVPRSVSCQRASCDPIRWILNANQPKKPLYYSISFRLFQGVIEGNWPGFVVLICLSQAKVAQTTRLCW